MCKKLLLLLGGMLLVGCSEPSWQTKDISGLMPPLAFELTNENGRTVSAEDYRGQVTLLFFGFTHCPDICPTTLAHLATISDELGKEARGNLQVLFVSVDPARDDPEILSEYTDAFGAEFIGLTGDKAALKALTRRYRVTYGYGEKDEAGNYDVSHSSAVFAFDRDGEVQLLIRESDPREAVVGDLRQLLASS
ncbi:protein SCO1/2 [Modicisalibacter xianhensis]|uniref:Protein SCO1/2 n=1 Tax=Modicisalibacter xianhensis TaxID=442341 RepID=A0A4R8F988_9GAMM|nr:SCO family protein [Halomonas xianhensis]TDX22194.1 protein SCO1/2 [Halomonas xianhensis]